VQVLDQVTETDVAVLSSEFDRMVASHHRKFSWDELYERSHDDFWDALAHGGWLDVRAGSTGLSTTLALAEVWGRYLLPLPFLPSLVGDGDAAAVSAAGRTRPTFALRSAAGSWLVPFGDHPAARVMSRSGEWLDVANRISGMDRFAPSLPLAAVSADSMTDAREPDLEVLLPHIVAEALGAACACFDKTVKHAKARIAYGKPIGSFQAVKHVIADMYMNVEFARSAVTWCASAADGEEARLAAGTALDLLESVAEASIQVHGGIAYTWEYGMHFYVRHLFALAKLVGV
jgi:hypothetical protein